MEQKNLYKQDPGTIQEYVESLDRKHTNETRRRISLRVGDFVILLIDLCMFIHRNNIIKISAGE